MPFTLDALFGNRLVPCVLHKTLFAALLLLCLAWSGVQALRPASPVLPTAAAPEWPREWDGEPLRPLALGAVEQRFADRFPGAISRQTDGRRLLVLRQVNAPTRMLHPAADCYRALGWRIEQARLIVDAQQRLWRCFNATRKGVPGLQVCERIVDTKGRAFTDTSAWYWAAAAGQSAGPWQAVTVAEAL